MTGAVCTCGVLLSFIDMYFIVSDNRLLSLLTLFIVCYW